MNHDQKKPARHRVIVERIDEPADVIADRLRDMWETEGNHHNWDPIRQAAAQVGVELDPNRMGKRRRP